MPIALAKNAHPACALDYRVYVDFDGTIAPGEPTDALFDRFADPYWREIEREWQEGRLTSIDCMARQVRLLRATPHELESFLRTVEIDPDFPSFARFCKSHGIPVVVLSDGLDLVIRSALRTVDLDPPFYANRLVHAGEDRWTLQYPHQQTDCRARMGNCKCSHAEFAKARVNIMIGDGRSDFCIAERSDLVLAKGRLADHCRRTGLAHVPIANFAEARIALSQWLVKGRRRSAADAAAITTLS